MNQPLLQSAVQAHRGGNYAEAARLYGEILRVDPRQFMALYGLGILHYQSGGMEQAERLMAEATRVNPASADCFFTRGCALQRLNRPNEALICFDRTVALKPDSADAHSNRGVVLMALNRHVEALDSLKTALALEPSNGASWNNRGCVLINLARFEDAIPCFDKALERNSRFTQALINRGSARASLKQYAATISDFEQALQIEPDAPYVAGNLALFRMQSSDWRHYEADRARIADGLAAGKRVVMPFIHLALSESPAEQLRCAQLWTAAELPITAPPLWRGERYRHDRIRVAYVSADFHSHATAELMAGVFERHDHSQFETIAISFGRDDESAMRSRVKAGFDRFIDVRGRSDYETALLMRQLETDIAIDLKGFTKDNRAGIFAHRPAPVQASYLGYPGTMGAPFMDYVLADPVVIPEAHREFYSEQVIWLPDSYQCNTPRPVSAEAGDRARWGLPRDAFVFCCFNNAFKISPVLFAAWMRLMRRVPGSVLWLLEDNPESSANLRREAQAQGIAIERLIFAARAPLDEHLARHAHADLFLDTQPYGAHTTASDALWAGVPVLTIAGTTFAARVAASLLTAADLPELIASDLHDYEAMALRLASDPEMLKSLRQRLAANRESARLFDTARFTCNLESALRTMHARAQNGMRPEHIKLPSGAPDGEVRTLIERGAQLGDAKRYAESAAEFEKATRLAPDHPWLWGNLVLSRLRGCDWRDLDSIRDHIARRVARGERALAPFVEIALSASPQDQLKCASIWAQSEAPPAAPLWNGELYRHEKIRIAYVSGDFHAHATAALMAGVFEHHDRSRFEPIAISYGPDDGSDLRARVKSAFAQFIDVRGRSASDIAALLRRMEVDIAIDLKGYTENSLPGIFARRPAPVQVNYLGYPGAMGAPYIDYIIADPVVAPPEHEPFYTEKIVRLPVSYQCNDSRRPIVPPAPSRQTLGLPADAFVFCCFNGSYKIMPDVFGVWMDLLRDVPGSVLWLLDDNADAVRNLRHEAAVRGADPERLIFAPKMDVADHFARQRAADLFLDTLPVGAHTTASDALWAGLPVLTMLGSAFAGRVAASLLHAIGLPELVAMSLDEYRGIALRLASDPAELRNIRTKLAANRQTHPLFDTEAYTRQLESALVTMWERAQRRQPPQAFTVPRSARAQTGTQGPIPDAATAAFMQGCRLARENDLSAALAQFDDAVAAAPHFVEALTNRGAILLARERPAEAFASLDQAVAINPAMTEAWNNRGNALSALGRFEEAVASFDAVLALRPRQIEALINRGTALLALRRREEALGSYEDAVAVDARNSAALHGQANALFELKRFGEAADAYAAAATADPSCDVAGIAAFSRLQCCDWRRLQQDRATLSGSHLHAGRLVDPFQYLAISDSPADQKRCAELWTAAKHPARAPALWNGEDYRHERLRVAFLSADFRNHPVTQAMTGVWECLDKERFETIGIGWGATDGSGSGERAIRSFGQFRNINSLTDDEAAWQIRELEADIVIDLMGYTAECRPGILAKRPAPVQASFLGFAGAMGAPYIDCIITDEIAAPAADRQHFTETLVHLPGTFFPIDNRRAIAATPSREEAGLPGAGFVFACFNNTYKFTPEMLDVWMRLLRQIDGSVLWLSPAGQSAAGNLKREAELRGVDAARLIFAPFIPEPDRHLARLRLADLFLDTLPYNAHATAADALYAGLPVLTCRGKTIAGRVAASLLNAAGLPELVTENLAAYEKLALDIARVPQQAAQLKAKLKENRHSAPLFDTAGYAAKFESALMSLRASAPRSFLSTA